MSRDELRVVVAGGGVAALEATLALHELGGMRVAVELLAPEPSFWYRPAAVAEPFGLGAVRHFDLGHLGGATGTGLTLGALVGVDSEKREAQTSAGGSLSYDALLIACGAVPTHAIPGALTFRGPADSDRLAGLLDEIERGDVRHVAFAAPWGAGWILPLYELALMTAQRFAAREVHGVELTLVTPEHTPLQLFGHAASEAVAALLDDAGIAVVTDAYAVEAGKGELLLTPRGSVPADRVVALPRLQGQRLDGVPQTVDGFVPVDRHCRVLGLDHVFAAGDITSFPVKQGGIATQQADAAVEAILEEAGLDLRARPFEPVLRGLLVTGRGPRYLRHELDGASTETDEVSELPLWWPPTKIVGRRLGPFLASVSGAAGASGPPPPGSVTVDRPLEDLAVDQLASARPDIPPEYAAAPEGMPTVADVMSHDPLVVSSHVTLDDLAKRLRAHGAGSALVVDGGALVGILTARDLLRAMAAGVDPREAFVRQWMTAEPVTVAPETGLAAAEALMSEYEFHHLPVVDDGRAVGLLGLRDTMRPRRGTGVAAIGLGY